MTKKIIAVTGATGAQGGGVINIMKSVPGWKIRGVTRDPTSAAAEKLAAEGIEVVRGDFDDEASLVKAFEGVQAVFAMTNWWDILFTGRNQVEAGLTECEHGMNIARAAAVQPSLEHYIWSTCPSAVITTKGAHSGVPHMDYKALVDAKIKSELPALAAKTTYLYIGYYPQNMFTFECVKPVEFPLGSGIYVQMLPTSPTAKVLMAGDLSQTPGLWVRQILARGSSTFGKYANVALETWAFQQAIDVWSEVTGKRGVFVQCSIETYREIFGIVGYEIGLQLQFGEMLDPWEMDGGRFLDAERDLGIKEEEVVGFRGVMEKWKHVV